MNGCVFSASDRKLFLGAKDFDLLLRKHGAQFIIPRVDCDVDFEWDAMNWIAEFLGAIKALS